MQLRFQTLLIVVVAECILGSSLMLGGCAKDYGADADPIEEASVDGETTNRDGVADSNQDSGSESDSSDAQADATAADCSAAPRLRTNAATGGFFCAFYRADAAAGEAGTSSPFNCTSAQTCCNPGRNDAGMFPPAFCANGKGGDTPCVSQDTANYSDFTPGFFSTSWECADKTACANGLTCVLVTSAFSTGASPAVNIGKSTDTGIPAECMALQSFKHGGTRCKPGAGPTDIKLCSANDQSCPAGTVCTPFSGGFRDLAYCR